MDFSKEREANQIYELFKYAMIGCPTAERDLHAVHPVFQARIKMFKWMAKEYIEQDVRHVQKFLTQFDKDYRAFLKGERRHGPTK